LPDLAELLAGRLGIIHQRRTNRFEFFHLWYQEFLAARHVVESGLDSVPRFRGESQQACLPFAVGLSKTSSDQLRLMEETQVCNAFAYCRTIPEGDFDDGQKRGMLFKAIRFGQRNGMTARLGMSRAPAEAGPAALPALYSLVEGGGSSYTRRSALEVIVLVEPDDDRVRSLLLHLLGQKTDDVLWNVTEYVGNRRLPHAVEPLRILVISGDDPIAAGDAVWALKMITEEDRRRDVPALGGCLAERLTRPDYKGRHEQGHALREILSRAVDDGFAITRPVP